MLYRAPVADDEALKAHLVLQFHDILFILVHLHAVQR